MRGENGQGHQFCRACLMMRACLDCGVLVSYPANRCAQHGRRAGRRANGRGYGRSHQAARAALKRELPGYCGYGCGTTLMPDDNWVAAHVVDGDPSAGWLASCRSCNERAKRRRG